MQESNYNLISLKKIYILIPKKTIVLFEEPNFLFYFIETSNISFH